MKKNICAVAVGLFLSVSGGLAFSQEREPPPGPRGPQGRPPMYAPGPGGPMGARMGPRGMGMMIELLRDDPKLAGMMMEMHGEMMRIRGEEMTKMGEVMKRYGERLQKEGTK